MFMRSIVLQVQIHHVIVIVHVYIYTHIRTICKVHLFLEQVNLPNDAQVLIEQF